MFETDRGSRVILFSRWTSQVAKHCIQAISRCSLLKWIWLASFLGWSLNHPRNVEWRAIKVDRIGRIQWTSMTRLVESRKGEMSCWLVWSLTFFPILCRICYVIWIICSNLTFTLNMMDYEKKFRSWRNSNYLHEFINFLLTQIWSSNFVDKCVTKSNIKIESCNFNNRLSFKFNRLRRVIFRKNINIYID